MGALLLGLLVAGVLAGVGQTPGQWLALDATGLGHGQIWRGLSYVFAVESVLELLFAVCGLLLLGTRLEYCWGTGMFLRFTLLSVCLAGLGALLLSGGEIKGCSGLLGAFLVAYARCFGNEPTYFFGVVLTVRTLLTCSMLLVGALGLLGGAGSAVILLMTGAVSAWGYLQLLAWMARRRAALDGGRMAKLEF